MYFMILVNDLSFFNNDVEIVDLTNTSYSTIPDDDQGWLSNKYQYS